MKKTWWLGCLIHSFACVIGLGLCFSSTARAEQPAIGFSNLVVRLDNDAIGLAGDDYRVLILEALRGDGLNAVGAESLVFNRDDSGKADFLLGGTVRELHCASLNGRQNCMVGVEWEVLDVEQEDVVYRVWTRYAVYGLTPAHRGHAGRYLVLGALKRLTARERFRQALVKRPPPAEATHASATFAACQASPLELPGAFEDAAQATVMIRTKKGFGSGFFLGRDGLVLTAAHVVDTAMPELILRDRSALKARPIRISRLHDVALLVVEGKQGLPCLPLLLEPKTPGSDVYAIGAPASQELAFSMTRGILSGVRLIEGTELLQTDASISPGNSGGPLIDGKGRVLGIVSRKLAGRAVEGIGFAIPIERALGALGLTGGATTSPELVAAAGLPVDAAKPASNASAQDFPDYYPSLDPEGDAARKAWEEQNRRTREAERASREREREIDAKTPGYVKPMRWGGLALAGAGLLTSVVTFTQVQEGSMTQSEYSSLSTWNDVGWIAVGVGGAAFGMSYLLVPSVPKPSPAKPVGWNAARLTLTPGRVELGTEF